MQGYDVPCLQDILPGSKTCKPADQALLKPV